MHNPFLKLKRYSPGSENHATETLAACLSLSDNIKREFVLFLFNDKPPFEPEEAETFDVATQQIVESGIPDLLLESSGVRNIVVEVKVRAPQRGAQIEEYVKWLRERKKGDNFVFSLVKQPGGVDAKAFGAYGCRTWQKLYEHLRKRRKALAEACEQKIVDYFCNYLEVETIVSTWQTKQILNYGSGLIARHALRTLFDQVGEKLADVNEKEYLKETVVDKNDEWPRLEIGMRSWSTIFGKKANLKKLRVYYETIAVPLWEGKAERFNFEIVLWDKWEKGEADWRKVQPQLPRWVSYLKSQKFFHKAYGRGNRELEGKSAEEGRFTDPPSWMSAWARDPKKRYIEESQWLKMNEDELADQLFRGALHHCEIISGLPSS